MGNVKKDTEHAKIFFEYISEQDGDSKPLLRDANESTQNMQKEFQTQDTDRVGEEDK